MQHAKDIRSRYPLTALLAAGIALLWLAPVRGAGSGPGSGEDAVEAGLRALRSGNAPLAVTLLRASAPSEDELSGEAHLGLGVAYVHMERWDSASRSFRLARRVLDPTLQGWALYQQLLALDRAGSREEARYVLEGDTTRYAPPLRDRFLNLRLGWAREVGDEQAELRVLEALLRDGVGDRSSAAERLARIHADEPARARAYLLRALEEPGSDEARGRAARTLLEQEGPLSPRQHLLAGEALYELADWEGAVRALRPVLEGEAPDALRLEARYRLGLALYRGRHYREAEQAFSGVADRPGRYRTSAGYHQARAAAASRGTAGAVEALISFADTFPGSRWAPRALRDAAERLHRGDCIRAREVTERLLRDYPTHWQNADAIFQMGTCVLERGEREEAERWFERLGRGVYHPHEKAQGWYWAGRTASARGDSISSRHYLQRAADRYPDTWYGALAGRELDRRPVAAAPPVRWVDARSLSVPEWAGPQVAAGIVLLRVGLSDDGTDQLLYAAAGRLGKERAYELWELCVGGGAYQAAVDLAGRLRGRHSWSDEDPRLRNLDYPLYYTDWILSEVEETGLDPFLVLALMKQESAFSPRARSHVGARGLMQLMPATAEEWAGRLRLGEVAAEDLYQPRLNLRLGIPYLAHLMERFGSAEKALAAYNGGPTNVRRWERRLEDARPETFVESIGYSETRTYVRTILNHYHRYRYLWGQLSDR